LWLAGCNDSPTGVDSSGALDIRLEPAGAAAAWRLEGHGRVETGTGDHHFGDLIPGLYTVTWLRTEGWVNLDEETVTVTVWANQTVEVVGRFVQDAPSHVSVVVEPAGIEARWALTKPDGEIIFGQGSQELDLEHAGPITLHWEEMEDRWQPQPPTVRAVASAEGVTFTGAYQERLPLDRGFVCLPSGSFLMGSPVDELGHDADETLHQVTLTHRFWCLQREVTIRDILEGAVLGSYHDAARVLVEAHDSGPNADQIDTVTYANNPNLVIYVRNPMQFNPSPTAERVTIYDAVDGSTELLTSFEIEGVRIDVSSDAGDDPFSFSTDVSYLPVEVTWHLAAAYCDWLSLGDGLPRCYDHATWALTGDPYTLTGYRLPTEAEWEYACRAGTETAFHSGPILSQAVDDPNLDAVAWYGSQARLRLGMLKLPNAFGLYDMHGNLWEWTTDWYGPYAEGPVVDPVGPATGELRVTRGGFFASMAIECRSANRRPYDPVYNQAIGIRPVRLHVETR